MTRPRARSHALIPLWALAAPGLAAAAVASPEAPEPGAYEAQLCVSVAQAAAQCGAVEFALLPGGQAAARVHDIVYRLQLRPGQLDVFLFHGSMQIDEFSTAFQWAGGVLNFTDAAKRTRYELRLLARKPALPASAPPSTE